MTRERPPNDDPKWLSTTKAAKMLGIIDRTLYACVDRGEIKAYRFGRVIRFKQSDLEAFVESSRIKPGELSHLIHFEDNGSDGP